MQTRSLRRSVGFKLPGLPAANTAGKSPVTTNTFTFRVENCEWSLIPARFCCSINRLKI